jgi:ABC-2 type transport system permease protein
MNKMFAVFKREYLQTVRKKMFIIMTFLLPFLMALLLALPATLVKRGLREKTVVVVDGTGQLGSAFGETKAPSPLSRTMQQLEQQTGGGARIKSTYVNAGGADPQKVAEPYLRDLRGTGQGSAIDGVLIVPAAVLTSDDPKATFYSRSSADVIAQDRMGNTLTRALQTLRIRQLGVEESKVDQILSEVTVSAVQISKSGEQKSGGELNLFIGFGFGALLIMPVFLYGVEIMRGIIQEKNDRVVEVLISSMSPTHLLSGKILGLAAVGLTQTGVWLLMAGIGGAYTAATAAVAGFNVMQFLRPAVFIYFITFFILGYLQMVCVYAIGGAACNTERDAQQLLAPVTVIMMIPWFVMMPILTNPDSKLAVVLSMVPPFAPMAMFARVLVSEPPLWQVFLSIALTIGAIYVFLVVTAKVFRVGILTYGKRPTIPELWRWLKVA